MLNIEELSKELMNILSRVKCIYTYIYKGNITCVHIVDKTIFFEQMKFNSYNG